MGDTMPVPATTTHPQDPHAKRNRRPPRDTQGGSALANGGAGAALSRGDPCRFRNGGRTVTGVVECVIPSGHDVRRVLGRECGDGILRSVFRRKRRDAVVRRGVSYVVSCPGSGTWLYPRRVDPA